MCLCKKRLVIGMKKVLWQNARRHYKTKLEKVPDQ